MESTPSQLDVTVDESSADVVRVVAVGEIDAATTGDFGELLDGAVASGRGVEVDLSAISFIDSSGLRSLMNAYKTASAADVGFEVSVASDPVKRIFKVTGLEDILLPS